MANIQAACPETVREALRYAAEFDGQVAFLGGGTDLLVRWQQGEQRPGLVIDISQLAELAFIREENGRVSIGSATAFAELARHDVILYHARCLAQAVAQIGSQQIRNRGTLGGNVATASPAGDSLPALLVLDAKITLAGPAGSRRVLFADICAGRDSLRPRELITEIDFPAWGTQYVSGFKKIGSRTAVSIARLNMAGLLNIDGSNHKIREARLAVGALAGRPLRLDSMERFLAGKLIGPQLMAEVAGMLPQMVDELIPGRYSQAYKRVAIKGLAEDLLTDLFGTREQHPGGG